MPEKVRKTELPERWKRRTFLKACGAVLAGPTLPGAALAEWWGGGELHAQSQRSTDKKRSRSVLESANPILGTGWRGHMFPGATVPFGLVQLSPDSSGPPDAKWNIQATGTNGNTAPAITTGTTSSTASAIPIFKVLAESTLAMSWSCPLLKERTGHGTPAKSTS